MAEPRYDPERFLALQERCVREHKWFMGQRERQPIEDNQAWQEWAEARFAEKYRKVYERNLPEIISTCYERCGYNCKGIKNCDMEEDKLHQLIILC